MGKFPSSLDLLGIVGIRSLTMDVVQKHNPVNSDKWMGAAPIAYVLCTRFFIHGSKNANPPIRDRFVLFATYFCKLFYNLLR